MRIAGCVVLATLTACGGEAAGGGRPCTLIGSLPGVRLEIEPPYARQIERASMKVCWNDQCRTVQVGLHPSTVAVPGECPDGGQAEAACGASASATGGKYGFADVRGLPQAPVEIILVLRDTAGKKLLDERLELTPRATYPNGPQCPRGATQAGLLVENGRVSARS